MVEIRIDDNDDQERAVGMHGGNIYRLAEDLGIREDEVTDFSASINPLGVPGSVTSEIKNNIRRLCNYPDPDANNFRAMISKYTGAEPESIICGNGSTELIYLLVRALKPEKALIPAPTFSEYERALNDPQKVRSLVLWESNGFEIDPDKFISAMSGTDSPASYKTALTTSVDMAFLCNPNNPTGRLLRRDSVMKIAGAARDLKCFLVVDEAFIDFSPGDSIVREVANNPYLIVLRSMTKFYALTGLRVGYAVVPPTLLDEIKRHKEPWSVNTLAQVSGIAALNDISYRDETYKLIRNEKKTLEDGFSLLNIQYYPSAANYYLIKLLQAQRIISSLRGKGILLRDCSDFIGLDGTYVRVAVKSNRDNMRLLKELAQWLRVS